MKFTQGHLTAEEFLDPSNYLTRVAVVSPKTVLGDVYANAIEHVRIVKELARKGVKVIIFPELSLTGHGLGHFHYDDVIQEDSKEGIRYILKNTAELNVVLIFGIPMKAFGRNLNTLVLTRGDELLAFIPKMYLTSSGEYDEEKFFKRGKNLPYATIHFDGREIPIDPHIIFEFVDEPHLSLFVTNCENEWGIPSPGTLAMLHGATLIAHSNASSGLVGKQSFKHKMVEVYSGLGFAAWAYAAQGSSDNGNSFVYNGESYIYERGTLIDKTTTGYSFNTQSVIADVDLAACEQDKMRTTSFGDRAADYVGGFHRLIIKGKLGNEENVTGKVYRNISQHPFAPNDPDGIRSMSDEIREIVATAIVRRLMHVMQDHVILGLSGGIDSLVTMLFAIEALALMGLGPENVICVTMPYRGSTSSQTYENVHKIAKAFGITLIEKNITDLVDGQIAAIGNGKPVKPITLQNAKARTRKEILLALSQEYNALELGTGDLSEYLVGWMTYMGDQLSQFGVLQGIFKTTLWLLMWYWRVVVFENDPAKQEAIASVEGTPVSPELDSLGVDGAIAEETDDKIGPSELRDLYSWYFLKFGTNPIKIAWYTYQAFKEKYSIGVIKKWLKLFLFREIELSQFKRQARADGPKVGSISADSHNDRVQPSDMKSDPWLRWVERIPEEL
ncbi:NAD(+) synthase [Candidatus Woesebacteria bacterium]|nr:NAD(+) synthase [Candidatus Woesebacteria bacterium]MBP9687095.1 NAD(+) synthase [Candidatus Woesebacteria bacterium]